MNEAENNIRNYTKNGIANRTAPCYLSDEALRELIAETEAEPMMRPPKGFRDEIVSRVRQKRKRMKNVALFSYSMKVIAATAAALGLILIVPENIRPRKGGETGTMQEWQAEEISKGPVPEEAWTEQEGFLYRFSNRLDEACSELNGRLNRLVGTEGQY